MTTNHQSRPLHSNVLVRAGIIAGYPDGVLTNARPGERLRRYGVERTARKGGTVDLEQSPIPPKFIPCQRLASIAAGLRASMMRARAAKVADRIISRHSLKR